MSNLANFVGSTIPLGGLTAFPASTPNVYSLNGMTFLKTGVIALASAYPTVPAALQVPMPQTPSYQVTPVTFQSVASNGSVFVAVDSAGTVYSSTTGLTGSWTLRQSTALTNGWLYWTGTRFLLIAGSTTYWWSLTGTASWTSGTVPVAPIAVGSTQRAYQVGTNIMLNAGSGASTTFSYSTDSGATWNTGTYPGGATAAGASGYVAVSSTKFMMAVSNQIYSATTPATWTNTLTLAGTPGLTSDGTYVYIGSYTVSGVLAILAAAGVAVTGNQLRTQDGIAVTDSGFSVSPYNVYTNTVGSIWITTDANKGFTFTSGNVVRNLPGVHGSSGLTYPNQGFGSVAVLGTTVLGVLGAPTGYLYAWTGGILNTIDNFTNSSDTAGQTNFMRVA